MTGCEKSDLLNSSISDELFSEIVKYTHPVGKAIIFDKDDITEFDVNWDRVLLKTNYTGYEYCCNEFIVPIETVENIPMEILALDFLKRLKKKYIDVVLVVYSFVHDGNLEFRFHVFREDEGIWIDDFNWITNPFLCIKG